MLNIFNTLTRKKEVFKSLSPNKVLMYSCGPTVYNYPHIGNYRAYVFADLLHRVLRFLGYDVTLIMNLTDVDDKTIRDSQKEGKSLDDFTKRFIDGFFEDLKSLNILHASQYPRATRCIDDMVSIIKILLEKGIAYKGEDGSIYYSIEKFKDYGKLAHLDKSQLLQGASGRVSADEYGKENPRDFALWKAWTPEDGDVFWETELGKGRPGWHIECSAMSTTALGKTIDIHTGGVDLIFPHHENEIAQSEGAFDQPFVNYWLHNEWLLVEGQKMSKSLGNFFTLRDLLDKGYDSLAIRYLLLATHYRQQLNFTFKGLDSAKNALQRIWDFMSRLESIDGKHNDNFDNLINSYRDEFKSALCDDLEISRGLAAMFDFISDCYKLIEGDQLSKKNAESAIALMKEFDSVLGLLKEKESLPEDVKLLIEQREKARADKDWALSDKLRDDIKDKGFLVEDSKEGVRWKKI